VEKKNSKNITRRVRVDQLDGTVAWITGAATGIGKAAGIALAGEGAVVVLSGRRKQPLAELAAQPRSAQSTVDSMVARYRRLNIPKRNWRDLSPRSADLVLQPEDLGRLIRYVARPPKHMWVNELLVCPTLNRTYVTELKRAGMKS
jgi:NADP-dependent 3-hydroxy acid dehydrogenase YdfG